MYDQVDFRNNSSAQNQANKWIAKALRCLDSVAVWHIKLGQQLNFLSESSPNTEPKIESRKDANKTIDSVTLLEALDNITKVISERSESQ